MAHYTLKWAIKHVERWWMRIENKDGLYFSNYTPTLLVHCIVCVSSSPILIWVLQPSQCSKICLAQHWGRGGAHLSENESAKSELEILEKIQEKQCLFHWFVMSIVVTDHELFSGKISWLTGSTHKGTRKRSCKRTWQRNTSEKQTTSKNNTGVDKRQCFIRPSTEADQCWRNNNWTEGRYYRAL